MAGSEKFGSGLPDILANGTPTLYGYSMARALRVDTAAPPALVEWKQQEAKLKAEAQEWVKDRLKAYLDTEAAYQPRTVTEIMEGFLDKETSMPSGYARIVDRSGKGERFNLVRNTLEGMVRHKLAVVDSTLNARGRESAAYARPTNVADQWQILVSATNQETINRALTGIKKWLSLEGATLNDVTGVMMTRKSGGTKLYETQTTTVAGGGNSGSKHRTRARGRKPRNTESSD